MTLPTMKSILEAGNLQLNHGVALGISDEINVLILGTPQVDLLNRELSFSVVETETATAAKFFTPLVVAAINRDYHQSSGLTWPLEFYDRTGKLYHSIALADIEISSMALAEVSEPAPIDNAAQEEAARQSQVKVVCWNITAAFSIS